MNKQTQSLFRVLGRDHDKKAAIKKIVEDAERKGENWEVACGRLARILKVDWDAGTEWETILDMLSEAAEKRFPVVKIDKIGKAQIDRLVCEKRMRDILSERAQMEKEVLNLILLNRTMKEERCRLLEETERLRKELKDAREELKGTRKELLQSCIEKDELELQVAGLMLTEQFQRVKINRLRASLEEL